MATAFHLIEKIPCISPSAQSTQVSHTQALNILQGSPGTSGPIIRRPTPVKTVEQPMDNSESSTEHTQNQLVTPVSFASTTQDRVDIAVPQPVGQGLPQIPPVWVPLLQITSVTSEANVAASVTSQQSGTLVTTQPQQQSEQCRKCGKKNHPTSCCHKKATCRKCKGKDHSAKFCSTSTQEELKCTFCGKTKHSVENCKTRKKAERKLQKELKARRTSMVTSTATSTMLLRAPPLSHAQPSKTHQQAPVTHETMQQVLLQAAGIEERLQCLANRVNQLTLSGLLPLSPAPLHIHQHEVKMNTEPTLQQV